MDNYYFGRTGNNYGSYGSGSRRRRRRGPGPLLPLLLVLFLILLIAGVAFGVKKLRGAKPDKPESSVTETAEGAGGENPEETVSEVTKTALEEIMEKAERLSLMYDYDEAIRLISENEEASASEEGKAAVAKYEELKAACVRQDISQITHVFFHILIPEDSMDKVFDGDREQRGYNLVMTTETEFRRILQSMYDRGFVLVRLHDMAYEVDDPENGGKKMVEGDIMLPEGKKGFVMSQDDVCYYEYMEDDGFANRLVIGEDGRVTTQRDYEDGTSDIGSYDLIPILNDFIDEHPDFSYRGAKAVIAVTGYNGVFGYRTDTAYEGVNPNIEEDKKKVTEIARALRADGWELASHSWGHRYYGQISMSDLQADNGKWQERVAPLIEGSDIIIYAFGDDVADWHPYKTENERFMLLWRSGFRYFCNVDSNRVWVQKGNDYLRQGRRNLDGQRMWQDLSTGSDHLSDLFDVKEVFDQGRPTPVE